MLLSSVHRWPPGQMIGLFFWPPSRADNLNVEKFKESPAVQAGEARKDDWGEKIAKCILPVWGDAGGDDEKEGEGWLLIDGNLMLQPVLSQVSS